MRQKPRRIGPAQMSTARNTHGTTSLGNATQPKPRHCGTEIGEITSKPEMAGNADPLIGASARTRQLGDNHRAPFRQNTKVGVPRPKNYLTASSPEDHDKNTYELVNQHRNQGAGSPAGDFVSNWGTRRTPRKTRRLNICCEMRDCSPSRQHHSNKY